MTDVVDHPSGEARRHTFGWVGLGLVGALWVWAHWTTAGALQRLDRSWAPPSFLAPIERGFLLLVGAVVSVVFVAVVQVLFRRLLARRLEGVNERFEVLVFLVPVLLCLLASFRFGVMVLGPGLLLVLNLVLLVRGLPPSTPVAQAFGWFGRAGARLGRASFGAAGRGVRSVRQRRRARVDAGPHDEP